MTARESILFFAPYDDRRVDFQIDAVVAAAMRTRGVKTTHVRCDRHDERRAPLRKEPGCDDREPAPEITAASLAIEPIPLGSLITVDDAAHADAWLAGLADDDLLDAQYGDLPVGAWAAANATNTFGIHRDRGGGNGSVTPAFRQCLWDTIAAYWAIERVMDRETVDGLFLFSGAFAPYRAVFEAAARRHLPVLVHDRGRTENTFSFFEGETCAGMETRRRLDSEWASAPLKDSELRQIEAYLFSRTDAGRRPVSHRPPEPADVFSVLNIPPDAHLVAFFVTPSERMSAAVEHRSIKAQFDLMERVAVALAGSNVYLIARHDPNLGEAADVTSEAYVLEAFRRGALRPANVRILLPRDDISTHVLFPSLAAAIAPFGKVAFETTTRGIPTLVAEGSAYSFDPDYTFADWTDESAATKTTFLISPQAVLTNERLRRFYRKAYTDLYRFSVASDVMGANEADPISGSAARETGGPDRGTTLARVCAHLVEGRPTYLRPRLQALFASTADEDRFLDEKLKSFRSRIVRRDLAPETPSATSALCVAAWTTTQSPDQPTLWRQLPNAHKIRLASFESKEPKPVLRLMKSGIASLRRARGHETFDAWRRGLRHALSGLDQAFLLVTSERFRFHDTSIDALLAKVAIAIEFDHAVVPLSGSFSNQRSGHLCHLEPPDFDIASWRDLEVQMDGALQAQDLFSVAIMRTDWLKQRMAFSAEKLARSLFDEASRTGADHGPDGPLFLWE